MAELKFYKMKYWLSISDEVRLSSIYYLCDVSTSVRPLARISDRVSHKSLLATGSIPVLGSSRNTIAGSPISATAVLSTYASYRHWQNKENIQVNITGIGKYSHALIGHWKQEVGLAHHIFVHRRCGHN